MYYFFFVPLGTELKVRRFPFATVSLALINFIYFLLFHYSPELARRAGALAFDTSQPTLLTAFTACFVHADWFHLMGNLVYLVTFGPALEDRIRGPRFLALYLLSGIGSMGAQMALNSAHLPGQSSTLIVGASGAISGILGLFLVRCGFARVRVGHLTMALTQGQSRAGTTRLSGYTAIGIWALLQLVYSLVAGPAGNVAYGSHLGGLCLGAFCGFFLGLNRQAAIEKVWIKSRRYADQGAWFPALGETLSYVRQEAGNSDAWLQLARLNRILRRPADSVTAYQKAIDVLWREKRRHEAVRAARELRRHYPQARLRPALLFRLGLHLERHGDLGWAAHTLEDYANYYPSHEKAPEALLRAAEIEARLRNDLERAGTIYRELAERYPDTPQGERAVHGVEMVSRILSNRSRNAESQERTGS